MTPATSQQTPPPTPARTPCADGVFADGTSRLCTPFPTRMHVPSGGLKRRECGHVRTRQATHSPRVCADLAWAGLAGASLQEIPHDHTPHF